MKKLIPILAIFTSFSASAIPQQPINGGTGVANNNSNTITLGGTINTAGAFTLSGAFSTTIVVSANTVVTLPSGTHTLASNDGSNATGTWGINISGTAAGLSSVLSESSGGTGTDTTSCAIGALFFQQNPATSFACTANMTYGAGGLVVVNKITSSSLNVAGLTASAPVFTDESNNLSSTGVVPFSAGGLGFTTATLGDLFYASATNTPGKLADVATGQVLTSGGVGAAPVYSASPRLTSIGLGAAVTGPYSVYAASAGSVTSGGSAAYFGSGASSTAGNLYGISIDKNGVDSLRIGVNKNSATGQVPSNGDYISTFFSNSTLSIGRGSGDGLPSSGDIFIGSAGDVTIRNGDTIINTVGKTLKIKQGSNACAGSVTLSGATTTVNTSCAATGDLIFLQHATIGGTPGITTYTISNGVNFTITSTTGASDTSTENWWIQKAAP